jgi:hypothetical protein
MEVPSPPPGGIFIFNGHSQYTLGADDVFRPEIWDEEFIMYHFKYNACLMCLWVFVLASTPDRPTPTRGDCKSQLKDLKKLIIQFRQEMKTSIQDIKKIMKQPGKQHSSRKGNCDVNNL